MLLKAFKVEVQFWSLLASPHPKSRRQSSHRVHVPCMPMDIHRWKQGLLIYKAQHGGLFFFVGVRARDSWRGSQNPEARENLISQVELNFAEASEPASMLELPCRVCSKPCTNPAALLFSLLLYFHSLFQVCKLNHKRREKGPSQ